MSPFQTRSRQTKTVTTQVLLNKNWSKWQQPSNKESKQCKVAKPASKENPLTLAKPRYSSKQLSHSLLLLRREFTACQDTSNRPCALTLLPTAWEEFMTLLPNWNRLPFASSGYDTVPSSPSSSPSPDELQQFLMSTGHRAKHCTACVWDECETHMEGKDRHYYHSGPNHIPTPSPLYSASCFITPHHPKRRFEDR